MRRTIILAYTLSGLSAAVGGLLLVGYSGQAYLGMGDNYLLPVIAVVVIGGTSIFGGKGSYVQTVAGALLITVITSALVSSGVEQSGQNILYGGIILAMAFFNQVALSGRRVEALGVPGLAPARRLGAARSTDTGADGSTGQAAGTVSAHTAAQRPRQQRWGR